MRDKLVRVQFKTIRHCIIEEIGDDVLNSVRCIAPALVADSEAAEHEYRLFRILEIGPGVPGLVQVEEMHNEAPGAVPSRVVLEFGDAISGISRVSGQAARSIG